jgi:hypothetical protein
LGSASHAEVMFERGLGGVFDDQRRAVHHLRNEGGGHRGGDANLRLAAAFGAGERGVVFAQVADRCASQQALTNFVHSWALCILNQSEYGFNHNTIGIIL